MKEVKFRAWHKSAKQMIYRPPLEHTTQDEIACYAYDDDQNQIRLPLMQYTGLKDKNGREIYEGDILELYYDRWLDETAPVWFHKYRGAFGYGPDVHFTSFDFLSRDIDDPLSFALKVIGNIYENPDLLNEK